MPQFDFKGRSGNGQLVDGEIEGSSSNAVAGLLMDRGVTPISIVEKKQQVDVVEVFRDRFDLHKISIEELLMFTRQMGALIKAGIPIPATALLFEPSISPSTGCPLLFLPLNS